MDSPHNNEIRVALIGPVSAGKSTLSNALFVAQYSDTKIKRTTTMPQVYIENNSESSSYNKKNVDTIREKNRELNQKVMDSTAEGKCLTYDDIKEVIYNVPKIHDFVTLKDGINFRVYDLPGLNDSMTKNVYYQYIKNNFHMFDIIIMTIDIQSAFNTSDETDILKTTLECMKLNHDIGIETKLIILLNKCDDIEIKNNVAVPVVEELCEMYDQAKKIVATYVKNHFPKCDDNKINILCVALEDSYIYRSVKKNGNQKDFILDDKHLNKIGINEYNKSEWLRKTHEERKAIFNTKIKKTIIDDFISKTEYTGFNLFKSKMNEMLNESKQLNIVLSHIMQDAIKYVNGIGKINNEIEILKFMSEMNRFYDDIMKLYKKFNKECSSTILDAYVEKVWNHYYIFNEKYYGKYDMTTENEYKKMNDVLELLCQMNASNIWFFKKIGHEKMKIVKDNIGDFYVKMAYSSTTLEDALLYLEKLKKYDHYNNKIKGIIMSIFCDLVRYTDVLDATNSPFDYDKFIHSKLTFISKKYVLSDNDLLQLLMKNTLHMIDNKKKKEGVSLKLAEYCYVMQYYLNNTVIIDMKNENADLYCALKLHVTKIYNSGEYWSASFKVSTFDNQYKDTMVNYVISKLTNKSVIVDIINSNKTKNNDEYIETIKKLKNDVEIVLPKTINDLKTKLNEFVTELRDCCKSSIKTVGLIDSLRELHEDNTNMIESLNKECKDNEKQMNVLIDEIKNKNKNDIKHLETAIGKIIAEHENTKKCGLSDIEKIKTNTTIMIKSLEEKLNGIETKISEALNASIESINSSIESLGSVDPIKDIVTDQISQKTPIAFPSNRQNSIYEANTLNTENELQKKLQQRYIKSESSNESINNTNINSQKMNRHQYNDGYNSSNARNYNDTYNSQQYGNGNRNIEYKRNSNSNGNGNGNGNDRNGYTNGNYQYQQQTQQRSSTRGRNLFIHDSQRNRDMYTQENKEKEVIKYEP
jgi:hypothetical protein